MRTIYVAGRYRADTHEGIAQNIRDARKVAIYVWERGDVALCPHLNTAHFEMDCNVPEETYLEGDLLLLEMCSGLITVPGWERSVGARKEVEYAQARNMTIEHFPALGLIEP